MTAWLEVHRVDLPLIVSFPHTGTDIPREIENRLISAWSARKDVDWWVHRLYDWASGLGANTIRTSICRTVIDVNRDPSGASPYPGQATTELCPLTTFDGELLYAPGREPQMGFTCRGYRDEPDALSQDNWPPRYEASRAEPLRTLLESVLCASIKFTRAQRGHSL